MDGEVWGFVSRIVTEVLIVGEGKNVFIRKVGGEECGGE